MRRGSLRAVGASLCAISLATECGARTASGAQAPERAIHARLEFPLIGNGKPTGLLAADLDGDGKSELVAITSSPPTLQICTGFSRVLLGWPDPRPIAIDDFALGPVWFGGRAPNTRETRVTSADIVYASRATSKVVVVDALRAWKTKTDDELVKKLEVTLPKRPRVIASDDLDGDGKFEIAVITVDDQLIIIRGPDDVVTTKLEDQQATCVAFGANRELFVGFQGSRNLVRYTIGQDGKAVRSSSIALEGLPRAIFARHESGGSQLIVAGGDNVLWDYWSELQFTGPNHGMDGGLIPFALVDGYILGTEGLVSIALQGQEAIVHARRHTLETHGPPIARVYAGQHPRAGAIGDFDGDDFADLAIANGDAQRISVLFATKENTFDIAQAAKSGRQVHALACGDLDGDKKPEVVSISTLEGTLSVSKNADGKLEDHRVQGRADGGDAVRITDLDGDGANDVVFLKRRSEMSTVIDAYFGDGKGNLFQRAEVRPLEVGSSAGDLLVTDLDGDGQLEALVADPEGGRVAIVNVERVKDAGAQFKAPRGISVESGPKRLALIDVEGDTQPEIAVALAGPGKTFGVAFLRAKKSSDGALVLELIRVQPSPTPIAGIAVADNDQNGYQDLVLLASKSDFDNHLEVWYQAPDRSFAKADEELPTGLRPFALRMADLDGDSISDIVVTAQNSHHVNVWLNGGGTPIHFARLADFGVGTGPLDVQLADLDGDGQVEIVVANAFSNDISIVRVR